MDKKQDSPTNKPRLDNSIQGSMDSSKFKRNAALLHYLFSNIDDIIDANIEPLFGSKV